MHKNLWHTWVSNREHIHPKTNTSILSSRTLVLKADWLQLCYRIWENSGPNPGRCMWDLFGYSSTEDVSTSRSEFLHCYIHHRNVWPVCSASMLSLLSVRGASPLTRHFVGVQVLKFSFNFFNWSSIQHPSAHISDSSTKSQGIVWPKSNDVALTYWQCSVTEKKAWVLKIRYTKSYTFQNTCDFYS
jgi:hypothetical protein